MRILQICPCCLQLLPFSSLLHPLHHFALPSNRRSRNRPEYPLWTFYYTVYYYMFMHYGWTLKKVSFSVCCVKEDDISKKRNNYNDKTKSQIRLVNGIGEGEGLIGGVRILVVRSYKTRGTLNATHFCSLPHCQIYFPPL